MLTMYATTTTTDNVLIPDLFFEQEKATPTAILATTTVQKEQEITEQHQPGPFAVVCGRGKLALTHSGNKRYKVLLKKFATKYSQAESKVDKSLVVSEIVGLINSSKPNPSSNCIDAGFVKQANDGRWYRIKDDLAREKIGANLRDLLHKQYKSSTKSKWQRRRVEIVDEMEAIVTSNPEVRLLTEKISYKMIKARNISDDEHVLQLLTQANIDILKAIKSDATLQMHK